MKDLHDTLMGFKPEDIRIFMWKGREGQNGKLTLTHLPSGTSANESLYDDSIESVIQARDRLLLQIKKEIGIE